MPIAPGSGARGCGAGRCCESGARRNRAAGVSAGVKLLPNPGSGKIPPDSSGRGGPTYPFSSGAEARPTLFFRMAIKLSVQQQSQLAMLSLLPPKIQRIQSVIEQMAGDHADEAVVRGMVRMLDEMKAYASQLKMNGLADAAGQMASTGRRGGGTQVKVRGLRENMATVRMNYDMALRKASIPPTDAHEDEGAPEPPIT